MYLFCISCKQIVATIKVPTLVYQTALDHEGHHRAKLLQKYSQT